MKLTTSQQEVMDRAKARIDFARSHNFYDWFRKCYRFYESNSEEDIDKYIEKEEQRYPTMKDYYKNRYEGEINAITIVMANTRTLKALEKLGLIEMLEEGGSYPDSIKIINY